MTPKRQQQRARWLIAALRNDRLARAQELIRQGADLTVRTPDGETALYAALAYGHHHLVPLLLEHGAVGIRHGRGERILERCDGFDQVVELLAARA